MKASSIMDKNIPPNHNSSLITIIIILVLIVLLLSLSVGFLLARNTIKPDPTAIYSEATLQIVSTSTLPQALTATPKLEEAVEPTLAFPSSTIQPGLPQSYTATPQTAEVVITSEIATQHAREQIPSDVLMDPSILFTSENMNITGNVIIPMTNSSGVAEIIGVPEINDDRITINVLSAKVNGEDLPEILVIEIEGYINKIFAGFLRGLRVQSFELGEDSLRLTAVEQK